MASPRRFNASSRRSVLAELFEFLVSGFGESDPDQDRSEHRAQRQASHDWAVGNAPIPQLAHCQQSDAPGHQCYGRNKTTGQTSAIGRKQFGSEHGQRWTADAAEEAAEKR